MPPQVPHDLNFFWGSPPIYSRTMKSKNLGARCSACQFTVSTISCRAVMELLALAAEKAPLNCR